MINRVQAGAEGSRVTMIMRPIETIVVIVDGQATHQAGLAKAALLAQKYQTRMDLFAYGGVTLSTLESLARPLRDRGLEVTTTTVFADSLSAALAERLRYQRAKFVVKDVARSASSRRAALTQTDWELMRTCPVPLLLSKPTLWSERPQICAAIDPGHDDEGFASLDDLLMDEGAMLAGSLGGQLHVLHAYIPPTFVMTTPLDDVLRAVKLSQKLMTTQPHAKLRELRTFASGYDVPPSHVHFSNGPACEVLAGFVAQLGASVVIMGRGSRAALRGDVIGSTAEGLLRNTPCDALVVKASQAMSFH